MRTDLTFDPGGAEQDVVVTLFKRGAELLLEPDRVISATIRTLGVEP